MASLRRIPVLIQTSHCFNLGNISNPQLRLAHSNGWTRFLTTRGCATSSSNPNTSSTTSFSFDDKSAKNSASSPTTPDVTSGDGVQVVYFRGLPQFTVPLPSRKENCRFTVKPLTNTVGDLLEMIKQEDRGIDRVALLSTEDGVRIGSSNTIEILMEHDFDLVINDKTYRVRTPPQEKPSPEELERLSSVRNLVGQLYAALNVDEHQLRVERQMLEELEKLQLEVGPLEKKRELIAQQASKRTNVLTWVGLGLMSVQFGILARLTWWEYSWDIMEPVTYFVTYGTAMLAYAYFVLTKQEYVLPDVKDRQYLITFHKNAKKLGLDVERYNQLKDQISTIQNDLQRLRDPLTLRLPLKSGLPKDFDFSKIPGQETSYSAILNKLQAMLKKAQNNPA